MSTNSTISMYDDKTGKIKVIYCHWDGYIEHNGEILLNHYKTKNKVTRLINLGDLSILGERTSCPAGHSYETPVEGYCVSINRDRNINYKNSYEVVDNIRDIPSQEYNYLFKDGEWLVNIPYESTAWYKLEDKLKNV